MLVGPVVLRKYWRFSNLKLNYFIIIQCLFCVYKTAASPPFLKLHWSQL